jgi:heat shock protein HtpX
VLLQMLQFSIFLLGTAFFGFGLSFEDIAGQAFAQFKRTWPIATLLAMAWFVIAYVGHHALIRLATGAKPVERKDAPGLYNALENLCISRGIPMPKLEIIDSPALNAYAAGLREGDYLIAVTRGLIETLSPAELEAVLAHELTHIRNRDTQMMVIAVIFAGVFAFFGDLLFRAWDFPYGIYPRSRRTTRSGSDSGWTTGTSTGSDSKHDRNGGPAGALIAIAIAVAIILLTGGVSTIIRFALSRSREYLADAGSVELTKNPDAMIQALQRISRNPRVEVISRMEAFSRPTHPSTTGSQLLSALPAVQRQTGERRLPPRSSVGRRRFALCWRPGARQPRYHRSLASQYKWSSTTHT